MPRTIARLLTIGHSYVIANNRRLAHEMALQGRGRWEVTAIAPERLRADLRDARLEPIAGEACAVRALPIAIGSIPHCRFYRGLKRVLDAGWDVVHVREEPYVASGAQIAALAPARARLVPATFQNIVKRYPPPFNVFEGSVVRRAAAWIAFGETVHEAQRGKPMYAAKPSRVIPPGVDVDRFTPDERSRTAIRDKFGWRRDTPVVGYLGRFVPEKGLGTLMRALEHAAQPWKALVVGGGPMLSELTDFSQSHPDRVKVLTGVTHDEVPAYLNAMDVLCAPSETTSQWREQFGRMLIEAMACGVPVIASRSGEIPHVLSDAGVLIEERDIAGLTQAIDSLLGDPGTRRELASKGLTRARERFAWPIVARAHLAFFEELL